MVPCMQTLRQLVAGTDFSECADQALALAVELALASSGRITLVHVCEPGDDELDDRHTQCEAALAAVVALHRSRGVELTGLLRGGTPWTKLDNVAAEVGASLIVIGRRGAGRPRGAGLGTVADRLVRSASRAVLTVACDFDLDRLDGEATPTNAPF